MGLWFYGFYVQGHPPSKHNQSGHYQPASETPSTPLKIQEDIDQMCSK